MTALGKLLRTTAFRLTLVYLLVFALFAAFLLGYFALNTRRLITEQITTHGRRRDRRPGGAIQPGRHPAAGVRRSSCARAGRGRASTSSRRRPARDWPATSARSRPACSTSRAGSKPSTAASRSPKPPNITRWCACSSCPGGFRLLVGRDLEERERLFDIIANAGRWSVAIVIILGHRRRRFRQPARAQPRRRDDADGADHHGRRSFRPAARSPGRATNSTGWRSTSTPCWSASRR